MPDDVNSNLIYSIFLRNYFESVFFTCVVIANYFDIFIHSLPFGSPLKGYHGVIKVNPMYPTIFNVVVDAAICYWVVVLAPTKDIIEGLGL